jgi:hypothetical protein
MHIQQNTSEKVLIGELIRMNEKKSLSVLVVEFNIFGYLDVDKFNFFRFVANSTRPSEPSLDYNDINKKIMFIFTYIK